MIRRASVPVLVLAVVFAFALPAAAQNTSGGEQQPVDSISPTTEAGPQGVQSEGGRSAGGGEAGSGAAPGQSTSDKSPPWLPVLIALIVLGVLVAAVGSGRSRKARAERPAE